MSKLSLGLLFSILSFALITAQAHDHDPGKSNFHQGFETFFRVFKKLDHFNLKLAYKASNTYKEYKSSSLELGGYFKFNKGHKVGFFFAEETGNRHTNDWVITKDLDWVWVDSSERKEYLKRFIYSYKFRINELSNIVYNIKMTYQHNSFENQEIIILKPNLHYFYLKNSKPIWSVNLAVPLYLPLNFEENLIYKKGLYTSFLSHYSASFIMSLNLEYRQETWTDSEDSKRLRSDQPYTAEDHLYTVGIGIIYLL